LGCTIRVLQQTDLPAFRLVRLRGLRDHPEAFGSSFEEEEHADLARLIGSAPNVTLGAFVDDALVGIGGLVVSPKIKQRHSAHIFGVYVVPEWRRGNVAAALLRRLIEAARAAEVRILMITVTVGNQPARDLYRAEGFVPFGIAPWGLCVDGRLLDEEMMALPLM
jgi:ribosomal protein S18 acetylase RimI-like enzyme